MSERKYLMHCFYTGRVLYEGTAEQLREYFAICGAGDPFDENGNQRTFTPLQLTDQRPAATEQVDGRPMLALVKR